MLAADEKITLADLLRWERELAAAEKEHKACNERIERLDKMIIAGRVLWPRETPAPPRKDIAE